MARLQFPSYQFSNPSKKQGPHNSPCSGTTAIVSDSISLKSLAPLQAHTGLGKGAEGKEGREQHCIRVPNSGSWTWSEAKSSHLNQKTDEDGGEDFWRKTRVLFQEKGGRVGVRQVETADVVQTEGGG